MPNSPNLTKLFTTRLQDLAIKLTSAQISLFIKYLNLLQQWNQTYNLTAITKSEAIIEYHFIDCLQIIPYLNAYKTILDFGSGAGFPGIVLAIANPKQRFLLIDKSNKKIIFLKHLCHKLQLDNVSCQHLTITQTTQPTKLLIQSDAIICRAVTKIRPFALLTKNLIPDSGSVFLMKGKSDNFSAEIKTIHAKHPNWHINQINLPNLINNEQRHLIRLNFK